MGFVINSYPPSEAAGHLGSAGGSSLSLGLVEAINSFAKHFDGVFLPRPAPPVPGVGGGWGGGGPDPPWPRWSGRIWFRFTLHGYTAATLLNIPLPPLPLLN